MKALAVLLLFLTAASVSAAECVVVDGPGVVSGPTLSSTNIRLVAVSNGKPLEGVRVSVLGPADRSLFYSSVTDEKGFAIPPEFEPGNYRIEARDWRGSFVPPYITVPVDGQWAPIAYKMDLLPDSGLQQALADFAVGKFADEPFVQRFSGSVLDPSGAAIVRASIAVWKVDRGVQTSVAETVSGLDGEFSLALPEGSCVALFEEPGFVRHILCFTVATSDSSKPSHSPVTVVLRVGGLLNHGKVDNRPT